MGTIPLLVVSAVGMLGWFFAWLGQRAVVGKDREVATAVAGEKAAKDVALMAEARASSAAAQLEAEKSKSANLQMQLDAERKARQDLVHALANKGLPVGDSVVDAAVDRLYPDGGSQGTGAVPGSSGDPQRVPGQPTGPSGGSSGQG